MTGPVALPAVPAWGTRRGHAGLRDATGRWLEAVKRPRRPRLRLPPDDGRARVVGRHPGADLVLSDPTVSRWHARLERDAATGGWLLTDLGSTNGTRVNGWRVSAPQWVRPGDRLSFGLHTVVLTRR